MSRPALLLDTHVFLWWLEDSPKLPARYRGAIAEATRVLVSAAAIWEMAIKSALGKLDVEAGLDLGSLIAASSFDELPVTSRHAAGVRALPLHHHDPFDRILISQARAEGLTIATTDPEFSAYEVELLGANRGLNPPKYLPF